MSSGRRLPPGSSSWVYSNLQICPETAVTRKESKKYRGYHSNVIYNNANVHIKHRSRYW